MAKSTHPQINMNGGEISPRALGRYDQAKWETALKIAENFLLHKLGGAYFRPGSVYVNAVKTSANKTHLIVYQYTTASAYVVEVGDLYMRFYTQSAQLISAGNPVEIVSPYAIADVFNLQYTQNGNVMYITHPNYPPYILQRTSATAFTLTKVQFIRGPFLDANITQTTIAPSAATGAAITLTAAASAWTTGLSYVSGPDAPDYVTNGGNTYKCLVNHVAGTFATDLAAGNWVLVATGANQPTLFDAGHVGSYWRIKSGVVQITAVTNGYTATAAVQAEPDGTAGNLGGTSAITDWQEGAFSTFRGFPTACVFHAQRLWYGGTLHKPSTVWASYLGQYNNFNTGSSTSDSNAITITPATDQPNPVLFLASVAQALQIGTSNGTQSVNPAGSSASITPTSAQLSFDTNYGVQAVQPVKISSYLYYLQKNSFALRELVYNYLQNRQLTADMNDWADHILRDGGGVVDIAYQQSPNDRIWVVRADGQIAVLTRDPDQKIQGWSRIVMGTTANGVGLVESIAIIQNPSADDQIWVVVKRNINGSVVRCVEYFSSEFFTYAWEPNRLDCSSSYDAPVTISGITKANPCVVTATAHGFSNGDQVKIDNVYTDFIFNSDKKVRIGMNDVNGQIYLIKNVTTNTFSLADSNGNDINSSAFGTYISGGQVRKMLSTFSGLSYLNGETVTVMVDGALPSAQQQYVVTGGSITLSQKCATVHVGLPYLGTLQLLKLSDGSRVGQTKMRRIYLGVIRLVQSLNMLIGLPRSPQLDRVYFQNVNDPLNQAPALFTGDYDKFFETLWEEGSEVIIQQDMPLPLFILGIFLRSEVEEII